MFADAGVDFPKDGMTWDEIFDLSKRLTKGEGENRLNGFSFSTQAQGDLFYGMQMYTAPLQLKMFDDAGEQMTVDTDQWEKVWTKMAQLQKIMCSLSLWIHKGNESQIRSRKSFRL